MVCIVLSHPLIESWRLLKQLEKTEAHEIAPDNKKTQSL